MISAPRITRLMPAPPFAGGSSPALAADQLDRVGFVRHHAEELERLTLPGLVPVRRPRRDEHHVALAHVVYLGADPAPCSPAQHVLLVLDRIRVMRHASTRC